MERDALLALNVTKDTSIREVIEVIDRSGRLSLALLVDARKRFRATLTDGDVRRAIMAGISLDSPAKAMLPIKARLPNPGPVTAPLGTSHADQVALMQQERVRQLPLLDAEGCVVDISLLPDLLPQGPDAIRAVIMAGGLGTRLRPLTDDLPKPMLPVGGRPLMERIVGQLRDSGVSQIIVTTHYKPEKIIEHFGDGREFAVDMTYVQEDEPLGTGGALGLISASHEPLLVINGDIVTRVDFRALLDYHRDQSAALTVGVRRYEFEVPYGVVRSNGHRVLRIDEKPRSSMFVNAGIYVVGPEVSEFIGAGVHLNMTDLIQRVVDAGLLVVSFPVLEYWIDIGRVDDYESAQSEAETWIVGMSPDRRGAPAT